LKEALGCLTVWFAASIVMSGRLALFGDVLDARLREKV